MTEVKLSVGGMDCTGCEDSIVRAVARVPGVREVRAQHSSGDVDVTVEPGADEAAIRAAIEDAGYEVVGPRE